MKCGLRSALATVGCVALLEISGCILPQCQNYPTYGYNGPDPCYDPSTTVYNDDNTIIFDFGDDEDQTSVVYVEQPVFIPAPPAAAPAPPPPDDHDLTAREIADLASFLDRHPELAALLEKNPQLANDPEFLKTQPDFQQFLSSNPGVAEELRENPAGFIAEAEKHEEHAKKVDQVHFNPLTPGHVDQKKAKNPTDKKLILSDVKEPNTRGVGSLGERVSTPILRSDGTSAGEIFPSSFPPEKPSPIEVNKYATRSETNAGGVGSQDRSVSAATPRSDSTSAGNISSGLLTREGPRSVQVHEPAARAEPITSPTRTHEAPSSVQVHEYATRPEPASSPIQSHVSEARVSNAPSPARKGKR